MELCVSSAGESLKDLQHYSLQWMTSMFLLLTKQERFTGTHDITCNLHCMPVPKFNADSRMLKRLPQWVDLTVWCAGCSLDQDVYYHNGYPVRSLSLFCIFLVLWYITYILRSTIVFAEGLSLLDSLESTSRYNCVFNLTDTKYSLIPGSFCHFLCIVLAWALPCVPLLN